MFICSPKGMPFGGFYVHKTHTVLGGPGISSLWYLESQASAEDQAFRAPAQSSGSTAPRDRCAACARNAPMDWEVWWELWGFCGVICWCFLLDFECYFIGCLAFFCCCLVVLRWFCCSVSGLRCDVGDRTNRFMARNQTNILYYKNQFLLR